MSDETFSKIMDAALKCAQTKGYTAITRLDIATQAQCSEGLVSHYFGTVARMRELVLKAAIARNYHGVVLQAIALKDVLADDLTSDEKRNSFNALLEE